MHGFPSSWSASIDGFLQEGFVAGDIFRWAALIAPLSREERKVALLHLCGERMHGGGYDHWSRARKKWTALIWAECFFNSTNAFGRREEEALKSQLSSDQPRLRENAAFAIWTIHAVPSVFQRCQEIDLNSLAELLLRQATTTKCQFLNHIAIELWQALDPMQLIHNAHRFPTALPMCAHLSITNQSKTVEYIREKTDRVLERILDGRGDQHDVRLLWDFATGLGRACKNFRALEAELEKDKRIRAEGGYLLAAIALRDNANVGVDRFKHAYQLNEREAPEHLDRTLDNLLNGRSDRPLALIARRSGMLALRKATPDQRLKLALNSLDHDRLFVRCSAVSCIRESRGEVRDSDAVYDAVFAAFDRSYKARGKNKPIEFLHALLHLLVLLDAIRATNLCEVLVREQKTHPALRGYALFWLGELWRERGKFATEEELVFHLLDALPVQGEYAINVAQALTAVLPHSELVRPSREFGIAAPYNYPLWRSSWG